METQYYIWSIEHNAWWRPDWDGYTINLKEAGLYELEEAQEILKGANYNGQFNECMINKDFF